MKCECCKRDIEKQANRKFCNSCSIYTLSQRNKISSLKYTARKLRKKLYGFEDGRQRRIKK